MTTTVTETRLRHDHRPVRPPKRAQREPTHAAISAGDVVAESSSAPPTPQPPKAEKPERSRDHRHAQRRSHQVLVWARLVRSLRGSAGAVVLGQASCAPGWMRWSLGRLVRLAECTRARAAGARHEPAHLLEERDPSAGATDRALSPLDAREVRSRPGWVYRPPCVPPACPDLAHESRILPYKR